MKYQTPLNIILFFVFVFEIIESFQIIKTSMNWKRKFWACWKKENSGVIFNFPTRPGKSGGIVGNYTYSPFKIFKGCNIKCSKRYRYNYLVYHSHEFLFLLVLGKGRVALELKFSKGRPVIYPKFTSRYN